MSVSLYQIASDHQALMAMAQNPEADEQMIRDTLEGLTGTAEVKITSIMAVRRSLIAQEAEARSEARRVEEYARAVKTNRERLESYVEEQMRRMGLKEVDGGMNGSVRFAKCPPSVEVEDISQVPSRFIIPQDPVVDKVAVKKEISAMNLVPPGIRLVDDKESLRWK